MRLSSSAGSAVSGDTIFPSLLYSTTPIWDSLTPMRYSEVSSLTKPTTVLKPDSFRLPLTSTAITTSCFAMHVGSGGQSWTLHSVDSKRSADCSEKQKPLPSSGAVTRRPCSKACGGGTQERVRL